MEDLGVSKCPMRTLRAPECAAGEHFQVMRSLLTRANGSLLFHEALSCLQPSDRRIVLCDFARARQHTNLCMQLRWSYWLQLPWCLFGIGHHDVGIARSCARRCLLLYEQLTPGATIHKLVSLLLEPGTIVSEQVRLFASGQRDLSQMPALQLWAAKFKFPPITERWIESRHALTKKTLALSPHVTMLHVAFHGIMEPLRVCLQQRPEAIRELASQSVTCRNPVLAIKAVGLWRHPAVVALRSVVPFKMLNRKHAPALTEIIFHADVFRFTRRLHWTMRIRMSTAMRHPAAGVLGRAVAPMHPALGAVHVAVGLAEL